MVQMSNQDLPWLSGNKTSEGISYFNISALPSEAEDCQI